MDERDYKHKPSRETDGVQKIFYVYKNFGNLGWGVFMAILVLLVCSYLSYYSFNKSTQQGEWVRHSIEVQKSLEEILSTIKDAETGLRGYVLTDDSLFLQPFEGAHEKTDALVKSTLGLLRDNPRQENTLIHLQSFIAVRFDILEKALNVEKADSMSTEYISRQIYAGKVAMDSIRSIIAYMQDQESILYTERSAESQQSISTSRILITIFLVVAIIIILTTFHAVSRSERAIKEREYKYRNIFEHTKDITLQLNERGEILEINPAVYEQLGYQEIELLHKNFSLLFNSTSDAEKLTEWLMYRQSVEDQAISLLTRDGKLRNYILNISSSDKSRQFFLVTLHDITELKKNEAERISIERFANVGKVARVIAHEVRNPLTNIKLSLENLSHENNDSDQMDLIKIIDKNADRINNLITELLSSTKLTEFELKKEILNKLVDETLQLTEDRAKLKNITVVKHFDEEICEVQVDKEKISMAILNLLINAMEAMPESGGVLTVETKKMGSKCVVKISDTGKGIRQEDLGSIFQPFYTTKKSGTGLGLATTQNIILNHRGTITLESEEGKGTTFVITLEIN